MDATMSALVSAMIILSGINKKPSSTILPEKCSNFSDVFDKMHADKLLHHSKHNLAIETEKDKQPLFSLTYDHFQLELKMLRKYIDKILGKRFIVPSKLPAEAPILFTKKKNGRLHLCVEL